MFHRTKRAMSCIASQRPLSCDRRNREDQNEYQVNDQECTAAVLPHHVREAPDIAEADSDANHRQDGCETRTEEFPCLHFLLFHPEVLVSVCGRPAKNNASVENA